MKIIWLCNIAPSMVNVDIYGNFGRGGLWMDHVLKQFICENKEYIYILCPNKIFKSSRISETLEYSTFYEKRTYKYDLKIEEYFQTVIDKIQPDLVHVWGTEYPHTLEMVNACEKMGIIDKVLISIQGMPSIYSRHYYEGIEHRFLNRYTLRDIVKCDSLQKQKKKFQIRGKFEELAIRKVSHVIGRTDWDFAITKKINDNMNYYKCNETLRDVFYKDVWNYEKCKKHSVFVSNCGYPIKGFHYLLEAATILVKKYPDLEIVVPGEDIISNSFIKEKIRSTYYLAYLRKKIEENNLQKHIRFVGRLNAEEMKREYLKTNVFVLPSTIENSPNSLGEAMLLGVPCVASDVGGVSTMMKHNEEGYVYQSTAPYMLAYYIDRTFEEEGKAKISADRARIHAMRTHNPNDNFKTLKNIYQEICNK